MRRKYTRIPILLYESVALDETIIAWLKYEREYSGRCSSATIKEALLQYLVSKEKRP